MLSTITTHTQQNFRRYQEDRFITMSMPNGDVFFGVFDGHGSDAVSEYVRNHVFYIFKGVRKLFPEDRPQTILRKVFTRLHEKTKYYVSGCTVAIGWLVNETNQVHVGILGDSSIVLRDAKGKVWDSPKHNVRSNQDEALRILSTDEGIIFNGYVGRVNRDDMGGVQLTRCLGDKDFEGIISRLPEIFTHDVNDNSWILCCTDGVIDASTHLNRLSEYVTFLQVNKQATAYDLLKLNTDADNATAIIIRFN